MAAPPGIDLTEETIFTWGAPPLKFGAVAIPTRSAASRWPSTGPGGSPY